MKPSVSIVLAALLMCGSASFGQSPPPAIHRPLLQAPQRFNLGGTWQFTYNGQPMQIQIQQQADQVKGYAGVGGLGVPDALLFEGRYVNGAVIGQRIGSDKKRTTAALTVADPDHMGTSTGAVLVRVSPARADDAICDLQNSSHTQAGFAYDRAIDAVHRNLPKTVNACWLQVSANQGHARAEAVTAMIFRHGEGVPQNYSTAFFWARKSAAQGDPVGEAVLGQLYDGGLGTRKDPNMAQYWENKANAQLAQLRAKQQQGQTQQQPTQTAQAKPHSGLTQSEAEGLAILVTIFAAGGGNSSQGSTPDIGDSNGAARANWESSCWMEGGSNCNNQALYH